MIFALCGRYKFFYWMRYDGETYLTKKLEEVDDDGREVYLR